MNKLDQLINKYCPDGIEYVRLGSICSLVTKQTGFDYSNNIKPYLVSEPDKNTIPYIQTKFFSGKNFNFVTDYYVPTTVAEKFPKIVLDSKCLLFSIVGASIGNVGLYPGDRTSFLGGAICVAKVLESYNVDYLFYCMESDFVQKQIRQKTKGAGQATVTIEDIRKFEIPVPPLPVQEEIVRILDSYTEIESELEVKLADELEMRKKQYEYYRDKMLSFENSEEVTVLRLGDAFASIRNGFVGTVTGHFSNADEGVRYLEGKNVHNGRILNNDNVYVTHDFDEKHKKGRLTYGAIVMVQSGHVGESAVITEELVGSNCHALIIMDGLNMDLYNPFYINYYFQTKEGKKKLSKLITGGTIKHINSSKMKDFEMPIPSLDEQNRIVDMLDKFSTLTEDISEGLPAEIRMRHQQYEYYRDKLLTFKRLEAV